MMSKYNVKRIFRIVCLRIVTHVPMSGCLRTRFAYWGGVKVTDLKHTSIGEGVIFDSMHPENIIIGKHVHITMRCVILTHHLAQVLAYLKKTLQYMPIITNSSKIKASFPLEHTVLQSIKKSV